jgi:hypothetical protein
MGLRIHLVTTANKPELYMRYKNATEYPITSSRKRYLDENWILFFLFFSCPGLPSEIDFRKHQIALNSNIYKYYVLT